MASVTGHLGSSATGNTDIRSPVSLGVTLGTGICPNTKIEFLNNGSGGSYSYWRNTHSGNTVTGEIFLCDSNGNNKVKIFDLSIAGGGRLSVSPLTQTDSVRRKRKRRNNPIANIL